MLLSCPPFLACSDSLSLSEAAEEIDARTSPVPNDVHALAAKLSDLAGASELSQANQEFGMAVLLLSQTGIYLVQNWSLEMLWEPKHFLRLVFGKIASRGKFYLNK